MMTMSARVLAAASWGDARYTDTRPRTYAAAMATAARAVLSVSSSSLISIAEGGDGGRRRVV